MFEDHCSKTWMRSRNGSLLVGAAGTRAQGKSQKVQGTDQTRRDLFTRDRTPNKTKGTQLPKSFVNPHISPYISTHQNSISRTVSGDKLPENLNILAQEKLDKVASYRCV